MKGRILLRRLRHFLNAKLTSRTVLLNSGDEAVQLLGKFDQHFALIEDQFAVRLIPRGHELILEGPEEEVEPLYQMFQELLKQIRKAVCSAAGN